MLTQKIQLGEEISVLAKKLAQEGKEVLCEKGFTKEQQEIFEEMFQKCFVSTADTTTKLLENGETYVFTGDIEAMWLRDSSAQVVHYLPFAKEFLQIRHMIAGLIQRQMPLMKRKMVIVGRRTILSLMIGSGRENMRLILFVIHCGCLIVITRQQAMKLFFHQR